MLSARPGHQLGPISPTMCTCSVATTREVGEQGKEALGLEDHYGSNKGRCEEMGWNAEAWRGAGRRGTQLWARARLPRSRLNLLGPSDHLCDSGLTPVLERRLCFPRATQPWRQTRSCCLCSPHSAACVP